MTPKEILKMCQGIFSFLSSLVGKSPQNLETVAKTQNGDGHISMTNLIGRLGCQTVEMNGGSSGSYLARHPCVPCFVLCFIGVETEGLLDYQGRAGIMSIDRWKLHPVIFSVEHRMQTRFWLACFYRPRCLCQRSDKSLSE